MSNFCDRLREERERLGLSQTAFGAVGGVKKQAQLKYEKGERSPDANYLEAVSKVGLDVLYVVTGERTVANLTPELNELVSLYQAAPLAVKAAVIGALQADNAATGQSITDNSSGDVSFSVSGSGHRVAGKNFIKK